MAKNPNKRLGNGKAGISEIKKHSYFKGINWDKLERREIAPPYVPTIQSSQDTKYVDKEFLRLSRKDKKTF